MGGYPLAHEEGEIELADVDKFIQEKSEILDNFFNDFESQTRKIAELAFDIETESIKKFGEKGMKVFRSVFEHSKFRNKLSYIRNVKYIPEKVYPALRELGKKNPAETLEAIGYSKFSDIARIGDREKMKEVIRKVVDGELKTASDIRSEIQSLAPKVEKKDLDVGSKTTSQLEELICPWDDTVYITINWAKREAKWKQKKAEEVEEAE